jgi:hypothetical protein
MGVGFAKASIHRSAWLGSLTFCSVPWLACASSAPLPVVRWLPMPWLALGLDSAGDPAGGVLTGPLALPTRVEPNAAGQQFGRHHTHGYPRTAARCSSDAAAVEIRALKHGRHGVHPRERGQRRTWRGLVSGESHVSDQTGAIRATYEI